MLRLATQHFDISGKGYISLEDFVSAVRHHAPGLSSAAVKVREARRLVGRAAGVAQARKI